MSNNTGKIELNAGRPESLAEPHIIDAIRGGSFTPFLGAGASSLRAKTTDVTLQPWKGIISTVVAIASELRSQESLLFVRSFLSQRLRLSLRQLNACLPLGEPSKIFSKESAFTDNGLLALQVELVRATRRLTQYFGSRFAAETPSIQRLPDCAVLFEVGTPDAKETLTQLFRAAAVARDLNNATFARRNSPFIQRFPGIDRSLETQRLHHKLLSLIVILLGRRREAFNSKLRLHVEGGGVPVREEIWNGTAPDSGYLRLDAVQWMSELLWYTLRYWIPCYPTTAEMAFELSLLVDEAPPRRAELAQAAQALENFDAESLAAEVKNLISYCDECQKHKQDGSEGTRAFYYSIAAAMQHQYDLFVAAPKADPNDRYRDDEDDTEHDNASKMDASKSEPSEDEKKEDFISSPIPPIIFTTNFDRALENIFDEVGLGYHVVYPMVKGLDAPNSQKPMWRFRTNYPKADETRPVDVPWDDIMRNNRPDPRKIVGPMIIKLHGAPCIDKPNKNYKHWMVLSEVGYLQALGDQGGMPPWLNEQLGNKKLSRRSLWFLGYSISDWNVRLRLFEHIRERNVGARSTVDREKDPYRVALLKRITVQHWVEDLTSIPAMIDHNFRIGKFRRSNEVARLTHELELLLEKSNL
jgi:hypothetical protein